MNSSLIKDKGLNNKYSSLNLFEPFNLVVFIAIYSPVILVSCIVGMSFAFQNFKGFIYLGFLIGSCIIRNLFMSRDTINEDSICNVVKYTTNGNSTFSSFVFAFTITYLSIPMFSNGDPNFWIFTVIISYFFLDLFIKAYKKCIINTGEIFVSILSGTALSALIVSLMYAGGSGKYLFFNEVSSSKELCYKPKNQTFKCSVYKNGELVGNI
jgi:hypothetical protein